jgi:tetratricopeptide (TPR) repeat protein
VALAVADQTPEARIRDLERRLDLDPGSRLFVSLAEEYRRLGRLKESLSALQKGLLAHPGYVAAQVALGRVYIEAGQTTDAVATFTKVLVADPGNLVAAKSLADIYMARGDKLEAVKKYKLYRALSGDRKVDPLIAELETQVAPKPVIPTQRLAPVAPVEPPPPPKFQETDKSRRRPLPKPLPSVVDEGPFDITALPFELGEDSGKPREVEEPFLVPTRDVPIVPSFSTKSGAAPAPPPTAPPREAAEAAPGSAMASSPATSSAPEPAAVPPPPVEARGPVGPASPPEPQAARPTGRALADLYYAQGHYADALQIYDDLVSRHPFDEDLKRMRRDAEARLLPAGSTPGSLVPDPGLDRRLARIRRLKRWLAQVQAG